MFNKECKIGDAGLTLSFSEVKDQETHKGTTMQSDYSAQVTAVRGQDHDKTSHFHLFNRYEHQAQTSQHTTPIASNPRTNKPPMAL